MLELILGWTTCTLLFSSATDPYRVITSCALFISLKNRICPRTRTRKHQTPLNTRPKRKDMESIFPTFLRVRRGLTDASHVRTLFERIENSSSDSENITLTEADRLAVLDLPNPDIVSAALANATDIPKQALLERAALTPDRLTSEELKLLHDRYWPKISFSDAGARNRVCEKLDADGTGGISARMGCSKRVLAEIERLRRPYYEPNESASLSNAQSEMSKRLRKFVEHREGEDLQKTLASPQCPEWAKRLLREKQLGLEGEFWGFARFVDPEIADEFDLDDYGLRAGDILSEARESFGVLASTFTLDRLDWPEDDDGSDNEEHEEDSEYNGEEDDHDGEDDGDAPIVDLEDGRLQRIDERDMAKGREEPGDISAPDPVSHSDADWLDDEDDEELLAKFEKLRKRFRSFRESAGLDQGTLTNTFIVIDGACAFSLFDARKADGVWVWAVDPDYNGNDSSSAGEAVTHQVSQRRYRGFLRVGLQQLVNKFFEARKYQEEEYSMGDLWKAAHMNSNRAFVSANRPEDG
jgi:hypothetical protein